MLGSLLAQLGTPGEKLDAVHTHFARKTPSDGLSVIFATLIIAVLLSGVLLLLNRVQQAKQQREDQTRARRRRELTVAHRPSTQPTSSMTLLRQHPTPRGR